MRIGFGTVAIAWLLFAAIVLWPRETVRAPEPEAPAAAVMASDGPGWQVLAPRHRGTSPAPLIVFMTPAWLGPVEVRVETRSRAHAVVTRSRGLPWPAALPPLGIGEWCTVTVEGPNGRSAEAAYLRQTPPEAALGGLGTDWMACGFPGLACARGGLETAAAALRAGLERLPEIGVSDTMPRARERGGRTLWRR